MTQLILSADLGEFFRQEVTEAKSALGIEITDETEFYVVNLLCDYSRQGTAPTPGEEPLALLYKRALEAADAERIRLLKDLGDLSLYVSGFFMDFVERSAVDLDYYIAMGGNAYGSVGDLVGAQRGGDPFAGVFAQLAAKFAELVDLISQISDRSLQRNDADLMRLYERWARTGSERIRKLLIEKGLIPPTEYIQ